MDPAVSLAKAQYSGAAQRLSNIDANAAKNLDKAAVGKAAEDVEAFFITMMIESMFAGIKTDGTFGGGQGEKVFRSMLFEEYGKSISKAGGFGISEAVQREMLATQEAK